MEINKALEVDNIKQNILFSLLRFHHLINSFLIIVILKVLSLLKIIINFQKKIASVAVNSRLYDTHRTGAAFCRKIQNVSKLCGHQ